MTASVIIPVLNRPDWTRRCLAALYRHTREPFELVLVDNGSAPSTQDLLRRISRARDPETLNHLLGTRWTCRCSRTTLQMPKRILLRSRRNLGFAAGVNRGLKAASGDPLILLNTDVLVPPGWLAGLRSAASRGRAGLAGPCTDGTTNRQRARGSPARLCHRPAAPKPPEPLPVLYGFCLLVTRATYRSLGGLDPRFVPGGYEDVDYCLRAAAQGIRRILAPGVWVHHAHHASWRANGLDRRDAMADNERRLVAKWRRNPLLALYLEDLRDNERQAALGR